MAEDRAAKLRTHADVLDTAEKQVVGAFGLARKALNIMADLAAKSDSGEPVEEPKRRQKPQKVQVEVVRCLPQRAGDGRK